MFWKAAKKRPDSRKMALEFPKKRRQNGVFGPLFGAEIRRKGAQYGVCGGFWWEKRVFWRFLLRKMWFLHKKTCFLRVFT
jgi:hypothetical protein